jgi:hypothetical protein
MPSGLCVRLLTRTCVRALLATCQSQDKLAKEVVMLRSVQARLDPCRLLGKLFRKAHVRHGLVHLGRPRRPTCRPPAPAWASCLGARCVAGGRRMLLHTRNHEAYHSVPAPGAQTNGLQNEELVKANAILTIDTAPDFYSLNRAFVFAHEGGHS